MEDAPYRRELVVEAIEGNKKWRGYLIYIDDLDEKPRSAEATINLFRQLVNSTRLGVWHPRTLYSL